MKYNISIGTDRELQQFYGKANSEPNAKDKKEIVDFLTKKNVMNTPKQMAQLVEGQGW